MDHRAGYDAPSDEDVLGRAAIAKQIVRIATQAPRDWSVRIGVYGRWGEGKTSVLKYVEKLLAKEHIVVWFNPWGFTDPRTMWEDFVDKVIARVNQVPGGRKAKRPVLRRLAEFGHKIGPAAHKGAAAAVVATTGIGGLDSLPADGILARLKEWARVSADEIAAVVSASVEGRRFVVLIDDLDRTDAALLPQIMFGLREVLDIPGFSWVLALDPGVVGDALASRHAGFASMDGRDFLQKIVEFPVWLPVPTPEQVWTLANREIRLSCPTIASDLLREHQDLLPRNPRALKSIIRRLWSLRDEIERHDETELNLLLLLIVTILHVQHPAFARQLFAANNPILDDLLSLEMSNLSSKEERAPELIERIREAVRVFAETEKMHTTAREHLEQTVLALGDRSFWTKEQLLEHAALHTLPRVVTRKEALSLVVSEPSSEPLVDWVDRQEKLTGYGHPEIVGELFERMLQLHHDFLSAAAEARSVEPQQEALNRAERCLRLLEHVCFAASGFVGENPVLGAAHFGALVGRLGHWAHFGSAAYEQMRQAERTLVLRVATEAQTRCLDMFSEVLSRLHDGPGRDAETRALLEAVASALEPRASAELVDVFQTAGAVWSIVKKGERRAERSILFRRSSTLWSQAEFRARLLHLPEGEVVLENAQAFLSVLVQRDHFEIGAPPDQLAEFLADGDLIDQLWRAAVSRPWNYRMFGGLEGLHSELAKRSKVALTKPSWWERLRGERQEREGPRVSRAGSS